MPTADPSKNITPAEQLHSPGAGDLAGKSQTDSSRFSPAGATGKRLHILLILEAAGGGAGRHVIDLARGLLRRNHNVCLVYSPDRAEHGFSRAIENMTGLSVHPLPMRRSVSIADLQQVRALRALIDDIGPFDVVHAHSSKAGALMRLALINKRIPCVYTPHAFITLNPQLRWPARFVYANAERLLAKLGGPIICVSEHERRHARRLGIAEQQLAVVHNAIETLQEGERNIVRRDWGLDTHTVCIGSVGRLSQQKAMDRLITAYSISPAAQLDSCLIIAGTGPQFRPLRRLIDKLGLNRRVRLVGAGDGPRLMAGFDIFALSSCYEACPYVLLEATERGLPIVMTDTGGAGSIVRDRENGYVVPQNDLEAFASKMGKLVDDPELRRRMGTAAGTRRHGMDEMLDQTLAVYRRAGELVATH